MIEMMMSAIGNPARNPTRNHAAAFIAARQRQALLMRRTMGLAIVTSGFAVIVVQALHHVLGG